MEPKRIDLQVSDKGIFVINFPCAVGGFAAHTNTNVQMLRPLFGASKLHI
jgi:hypothetical protein